MKNCVLAAIFKDNFQKVLIIKRRDTPVWVLPGGGIDENEKPDEAVVREVLEETGLVVSVKRTVGVYTPINRLGSITHLFECTIESGEPQTGTETRDIGFYSLDSLPPLFFEVHQEMLTDALERSSKIVKKPLCQVTYWALFKYFIKHPILLIRFILSQIGLPINSKD